MQRGSGVEMYYLDLLEYVSRKYQDMILDQKRWNHSTRITQMFVVDPNFASDLERALKKIFIGHEVRVIQSGNVIRIYVHIRKADQYTHTRS